MEFKVITPVATEPVLLDQARLQLKLTDDDPTDEDELIQTWITAAREIAEHYTGRSLAPQTLEGALDAFPIYENDCIYLPMPPVTSITSVKYTDINGTEQTVPGSAYTLSLYGDSRRLAPSFGHYWPTAQVTPDAVRIRFVAGYADPPKTVVQAILLMVAWMDQHRGDQMEPSDIQPPAAKALLDTVRIYGRR